MLGAGTAETTFAPVGFRQIIDNFEFGVLDRHDHELRDAVTGLDMEVFLPCILQYDINLTPVVAIDQAWRIGECYPMFGRKA